MSQLFYSAAVLVCPLGMGLMMWMMMRGGKGKNVPAETAPRPLSATDAEVARLRAEVDQLRAAQREQDQTALRQ
ncbi:MAG: hypothetical protein BGO26_06450 [Actinobacteria bacterium 69-20]|nr:hypothetical protein [Actinomycetota bacterium]OJV28081.1 MAG: hypothetical protein BGO26_06450 [Actinobacteria bacterium 69-20]